MPQTPQHPDAIQELEEEEARRIDAGFTVESDKFIHTYTYQDNNNLYPTKFIATNEEAYLQGEPHGVA